MSDSTHARANQANGISPEQRHAVRGVLISPDGSVLLMQAEEPVSGLRLWFAPGGGAEPGEDPHSCLRRELHEETGLVDVAIGPLIWKREHTFTWAGRLLEQHEQFYLIRIERFDPVMIDNPSATEVASFRGFRWWAWEDIVASTDLFVPRELGRHLRALLEDGPPATPLDVGV